MEIECDSLDGVLWRLYKAIKTEGRRHGGGTRGASQEMLGVSIRILKPRARISRSENRGKPFSAIGELLWYLSGSDRLGFIENYVPEYRKDAVNGILEGAYGPRLTAMRGSVNQFDSVFHLLSRKAGSRRAVIQLFNAEDIATEHKEIPCTTTMQFHLREGLLHMSVTMRSNDAYWGLPHDVFCFTMLQEMMARRLAVELGEYGRIYDHELVAAVQRIAGNGTGDTRWKVPGVLDWSTSIYNPLVDISRDTTTLYGSDRDVFLFLVDDLNPIEAGRLPDGSPDLYFRGFYCWNSEVGAKTLGIASFYLRAVCQNRNLWGVEDFEEITIRHSKFAASRFAHQAAPALTRFANSSPASFVCGVKAARERIVARTDEDRTDFLRKRGFSKAETGRIIDVVLAEEGHPPASIFDFVQGITAVARDKTHQDARLDFEARAKKLLDQAA